ncbi:hypothetical protein [Hymenobacter pini]|uniref:hypothetical protein n=1 Tax=Hymenobacter pini TaxID=2880879 RepID=UPI001CF51256|nr:hypothetical protein [Hymenobacter pini]MCA8829414.1 hypothetical protein [Hymenobacter pini]
MPESICYSCLAFRVDAEDDDRLRATLIRWHLKHTNSPLTTWAATATDEQLCNRQDYRLTKHQDAAAEIICLMIGLRYRPKPDLPPF